MASLATNRPTATLPEEFERSVRVARVPLEARTLLRHLGPWTLDVSLPRTADAMPLSLRQLLKLAHLPGHAVRLANVVAFSDGGGGGTVTLTVSRSGAELVLNAVDLAQDLRTILRRLAARLMDPTELVAASETFALELAREETVRHLSSRMLQAEDLDAALYAMLLGITSGYGAGFHRAALFTYDEETNSFRGGAAIGPRDEAEAHRIWEAIETEDKTLDQTVDDYKTRDASGAFESLVRSLTVDETDCAEVAKVLSAGTAQVFRTPPENASMARLLAPATEYVLSAIQSGGTRLGFIVADNAFGHPAVSSAQLEFLRALVDPTSLVWKTRSLLRKVDALARRDALTGLYNRRELEERLSIEQSRCARAQRPISIAVIDLDHFKNVNDTRGHAAGDVLLRRVGVLLSESLRQHDVPARYGGDEFVLLFPEGTKVELAAVTTRIGRRAKEEGISLSIGGATWPDDGPDAQTLMAVADAQLYAAKAAGRGCLSVTGNELVHF